MGTILLFAGIFTPRGWADCDGALVPISQNGPLFSLLGTTYGGDGVRTFGLPDLRGRVALGIGRGPGLTPRELGERAGQESVTLTSIELPAHTHAAESVMHVAATGADEGTPTEHYLSTPAEVQIYAAAPTAGSTLGPNAVTTRLAPSGQSQPHPNMVPYLGLRYIIAVTGIYPSHPD